MVDNKQSSFALRMLIGLAAIGLVLYFMYLMSGLINNLFIAYIVAIIASPLLIWLRTKNVPDWLAFVLTILVVAAAALLLAAFILYAASRLSASIPAYVTDLEDLRDTIYDSLASIGIIEEEVSSVFLDVVEVRRVIETVGTVISIGTGLLSNIFMVILFVVFMLVQVFSTPRIIQREIDTGNTFVQRILNYNVGLRRYFLITTVIAFITGALDTIWFIILGIPYPLVWGIVAAVLSFVPTIGFWLAAIPPTLLALFEYGPPTAVITFVGIVLINGFADNVIKPRYIGSGVDLAPFLVIFSVVFWAMILGPIGAVLGVPLTMLIRTVLFEPDNNVSWIAHVMGSGMHPKEIAQDEAETGTIPDASDVSDEV